MLTATMGHAQTPPAKAEVFPSPNEIVKAAPASDWTAIAPSDVLVMELATDAKGKARRVVIQLMPAPFSQGWVGNIRKLAKAKFWDGTAVVRVQDNYVTQWGDPDGEVEGKAKKLPEGLAVVTESEYTSPLKGITNQRSISCHIYKTRNTLPRLGRYLVDDTYAAGAIKDELGFESGSAFLNGWPVVYKSNPANYQNVPAEKMKGLKNCEIAVSEPALIGSYWPTHCYGMVGVGRNLSPDTGTGAELYTVIGHAPRHLDRNIALVGRIIEGMEHMSSLPRGTGTLGFYERPEERTTILSIGIMDQIAADKPFPTYEYLSTESESFAKYTEARANRRDPFFIQPAGGADICNIPVPVRRKG